MSKLLHPSSVVMASTARAGQLLARQLRAPSKSLSIKCTPFAAAVRPSSSIINQSQFTRRQAPIGRVAGFSTTTTNRLLPAGPQVIKGGVNDPAEVPEPHPTHGSYHWIVERLLSVGLIPLTLAPFAAQTMNPTLDAILVTGLLLHTHIGFQYVPRNVPI